MRIFWLLFDIFLVLLVCAAGLVMFAWWNLASWTYDELPFEWERPDPVLAVPRAASDLPAEHRITRDDIVIEEVALNGDLPVDQIMMSPEQIAGRVLRRSKEAGAMFLVTDLFLEGQEPGAPLEPLSTPDEPWPPLTEIELLASVMAELEPEELESRDSTHLLPVAIVDLPAGRMVRVSDIGLRRISYARTREESLPEHEVMMSSPQIKGRRLLHSKRMGEPYLLSDFAVEEEVEAYLREHQPNFKSRTLETIATEKDTLYPPAPPEFVAIPSRPIAEEEHDENGNLASLADDPESLFGPLPGGVAPKYQRATRELVLMSYLARRSQPIVAQSHDRFDFRDVIGTSLAQAAPLGVGTIATERDLTWFGGATLTPETYGDSQASAIDAMPHTPTAGDYTLTLPNELSQEQQPEETIEDPQQREAWWRGLKIFQDQPVGDFYYPETTDLAP